ISPADNKSILNKNLHINGRVEGGGSHEWSFGGLRHKPGGTGSIQATGVWPFPTCGCHTVTTGGQYPPALRGDATQIVCITCHINTTNFQGATPGCWDCHGSSATAGNAVAPNSNTFPNISGSHSAHIAFNYACADCHSGGGTGTAVHGNYSSKPLKTKANVVVKLNTATAGTAATQTWVSVPQTWNCSSTVCHGQKSPDWGQAVPTQQCRRCHGSQTVSYPLNTYSSAVIAAGGANIDTGRVSGVTTRGGLHQEHLNANIVTPNKVTCNSCHTVPSVVNHAKLDNRTTALVKFGGLAIANSHGSASVTRVGGLITCNNTWCHTGQTNTGSGMAPVWNNSTYLTGTGGAGALVLADCTKCHALPPASASHGGIAAVASFPIGAGNCGTNCHSLNLTANPTTYANIFTDPSKHMNGTIEGGTCTGCHGSNNNGRYGAAAHFNYSSHHVQGRAVTNADCFQCHAEAADTLGNRSAQHTGVAYSGASVDLIVWGTGARGTSYISYTANGSRKQIAKLNTHCLSCHNTPNASLAPFVAGSTTDKYSPEQRLLVAKAKTSIQSRYSS